MGNESQHSMIKWWGRRIDQMVRRIEATLDGISDRQELLTGIRALVRMIKPDAA